MDQLETQIEEFRGRPVVVLRYEIGEGVRHVMARRAVEGYQVYDVPVGREGRVWTVDSGCLDFAEVKDFLVDYGERAVLFDCCPMSREAIEQVWGALIEAA